MKSSVSRRPDDDEIGSNYQRSLVSAVRGECVLKILDDQLDWLDRISHSLGPDQVDTIHSPYQWSIRQVVEHCADAERVFGYRMLRFAAGDPAVLPGWDQNLYADSRFGLGSFGRLIAEMESLRRANLNLLRRIVPLAWNRTGEADGTKNSVRSLAWIAAGHLQHHLTIIENRSGINT